MSDGATEMLEEERITSDGSTASYYELPPGATQLQHLISYRNMNAQIGEIFRECYRYGRASHCDQLRGAKKILFYAQAEVERLEKSNSQFAKSEWIEWKGGDCPVSGDTVVQCKLRESVGWHMDKRMASEWDWEHDGERYDIVAYRIVK